MASKLIDRLKADGWRQQFTASGVRLSEALENYRTLGFEIKTIPVMELDCEECTICFEDANDETVMIFTRKSVAPTDDGLV